MKNIKIILYALIICIYSGLANSKPKKSESVAAIELKLADVVKSPEIYNGKVIITEGCLTTDFENIGLFESEKDCALPLPKGLWVELPKNSDLRLTNKMFKVRILGTVNSHKKGHMNAWRGTLEKIKILSAKEINSGK